MLGPADPGIDACPGQPAPEFRRAVLTAYERRCAICDFDVRLDDDLLGLDAAHIKWHAAGGPDRVPNGLALCKLHHHALDRGAIGLNPAANLGFTLLVSQELSGTSEDFQRLVDAGGRPLRQPQDDSQLPNPAFVAWHRRSSGENRALPDRAFSAVRSRRSPIRPPSRKRTIRRRTPPHILGNGSVTRDSRGDRTRPLHQEWLGAPCPAASESSAGSARNFSPRAPRTLRTVSNVGLRSPERAL